MANVLVVDDEKSIRVTLREFLRIGGHGADTAEDADAALALLREKPYDVVVSDIVMPRKTGVELLQEIRSVAPAVQVLIMTGEPTVETAADAVRAGAADYLVKPISKATFLKAVASAARVKDLEDERRRLSDENTRYQFELENLVADRTAELRQTNLLLGKAMEGIVQAMAATVESRDPYTAGHQQRVANLARAVAGKMNLPEEQRTVVYFAGVVHDIGKISVPAEILSKPGRLSEIELSLIRTHPQTGYNILKNVEFPWPIADIVLQHHERMDGSGYPKGLGRDAILREARILAVADVMEAMAAHRPYRPAAGLDRAVEEIRARSPAQYDPEVVQACTGLILRKEFAF
jgi:putative nucleotidyltransferase with HDIG domain